VIIKKISVNLVNVAKYNPRKDLQPGDPEYERLKRSVERWDLVEPLVWNKRSGNLVGGHQRLKILTARGDSDVDVSVVDLDSQDEAALNIALNKIGGEWDMPKLTDLLSELDGHGFDATFTGFDGDELENILTWTPPGEVTEDEPPAVPDNPQSKLGEIYELGRHRVMCGDSTAQDAVSALLGGAVVPLTLTDPPYSVNYDRSQSERGGDKDVHAPYHEGDLDPAGILAFMACVPSDVMVWTYPIDRHFFALSESYQKYGWELRRELVWVKNTFSFWPSANYQQKHEPIMVAARKGKPVGGYVPSNATTVMEHDKPHSHKDHPTAKPGELWGDLMQNHTRSGDVVYDPFLGSGTTLIAAEQLGRTCYGMEIEPKYVDVIRQRYANFVKDPQYSPTGELTDRKAHAGSSS